MNKISSQVLSKMNGFGDSRLDEDAFGESKTSNIVKAFDAFRECNPFSLLCSLLCSQFLVAFLVVTSSILPVYAVVILSIPHL